MSTKIYNLINKKLPIVKKSKIIATIYHGACFVLDQDTGECFIKFDKDELRKIFKRAGIKAKKNTYTSTLLHEFGHYLDYKDNPNQFVTKCIYEREIIAWKNARMLAKKMRLNIDENLVTKSLNTYEKYKNK